MTISLQTSWADTPRSCEPIFCMKAQRCDTIPRGWRAQSLGAGKERDPARSLLLSYAERDSIEGAFRKAIGHPCTCGWTRHAYEVRQGQSASPTCWSPPNCPCLSNGLITEAEKDSCDRWSSG